MDLKNYATGVQHIGIPTNDIDKTVDFYHKLGFETVFETVNEEADEKVVFLKLGTLVVETYENHAAVLRAGAIDHVALDVKDIEEIYQYISICLDAPQAADRLMTAFEKSFEQLQNHPFSFPRADDESLRKKGYRKLIVENYVGAYLLNEQTKEVVVMRFFYGARDYKRLL